MPGLTYQLTWKTLPGLRGLSCSDFRATPTASPETEKGVAFSADSDSALASLLHDLELHFSTQRFSNSASAFETVKAYVLERLGAR